MRMTRLWMADLPESAGAVTLSPRNHHHISRVLRAKPGAPVELFNGRGLVAEGSVVAITKQTTTVAIGDPMAVIDQRLPIVLCLAVVKPDRFDWALQKATELGVTAIQPMQTEFTEGLPKGERLDKKTAHWQEILINACEQSGNQWIPTLHPPKLLHAVFALAADSLVIAHPTFPLTPLGSGSGTRYLLIGPEGGFSDSEVAAAVEAGAQGLSLGPRILRAETAAVVGTTLLARDLGFL